MLFSILILLAVLGLTAFAATEALRISQDMRKLEAAMQILATQRDDRRYAGERSAQLVQGQALTEGAVRGTTSAVRAIHMGIASIPFGILESIPVARPTARFVRNIHDRTADGVYGTIETVNRLVGGAARASLAISKPKAMLVNTSVAIAAHKPETGGAPVETTRAILLNDGRAVAQRK